MKTAADTEKDVLDKVREGFRRVGLSLPYLVGLIQKLRVQVDNRVETVGVFASGRLAVNADFVRSLSSQDLQFVLTHELYHLTLRTHERSEGTDLLEFNHAHDYIINDILREELRLTSIPAGGMDWPGARQMSAEEILLQMDKNPNHVKRGNAGVWRIRSRGRGAGANRQGSGQDEGTPDASGPQGDVLDSQLERDWFADDPAEQQASEEAVQEVAAKSLSLGRVMDAMKDWGRGTDPGAASQLVTALRGLYRTPWEMALQRWLGQPSRQALLNRAMATALVAAALWGLAGASGFVVAPTNETNAALA